MCVGMYIYAERNWQDASNVDVGGVDQIVDKWRQPVYVFFLCVMSFVWESKSFTARVLARINACPTPLVIPSHFCHTHTFLRPPCQE